MSQGVHRDVLAGQAGAGGRCGCDVGGQAMLECIAGQEQPAGTAEQCGPGPGGPLGEVGRHRAHGRVGQGRDALPSSLAGAGDAWPGAEVDVIDRERADLADAKAGLHGHGQQGVVTSSGPGRRIGCCEEGDDFVGCEELDDRSGRAFGWDREDLGDRRSVFGLSLIHI